MNRQTGFTLLELLIVIALIATLSSLAALTFKESSGANKLSTAGSRITSLMDSVRETAILRQQPIAIALLASGDNVANRVFTSLGYVPPPSPNAAGEWKQIGKWETLPQGVLANSGVDSNGNNLKALTPASSVIVTPALPSLSYRGVSYAPRDNAGYGYLIFMADGSLYQDTNGSLPSPCVLSLVEGIHNGSGITLTGQTNQAGRVANYFEILLNQATGRTKVIRP